MGLLTRLIRALGHVVLRALALLAALFLVHMIVSRTVPELRETWRAVERGPSVEQRLAELEQQLERDVQGASKLELELSNRSQRALLEYSERASDWERRLSDLQTQRERLSDQIEALRRERDEACDSFNPLEWWVCRRLEQRFGELSERLVPHVESLNADIAVGRAAAEELRGPLRILHDPSLSDAEKMRQLGMDDASELGLQFEVTQKRLADARKNVSDLKADLEHIRALEDSTLGVLVREWRAVHGRLLWIVGLILLLPYLQRVLNYFVLMPLVSRFAAPLRLAPEPGGDLRCGPAERSLVVSLGEGEQARVRSEYARPVQGRVTGQLLYSWRAPFISYAAGLRLLTKVRGVGDAEVQLTLAAPEDPNSYLMRLELSDHPGLVIHPKHLVGVVGEPRLRTRWRLFSVHAWATWQLRYILFTGTGSVIVEGSGDVIATRPGAQHPTKIEQKLVIGFDSRLDHTTGRTEVFWPYLLGKTPLVDDVFLGAGAFFWQKSSFAVHQGPVVRTFNALFSALGKLLGF